MKGFFLITIISSLVFANDKHNPDGPCNLGQTCTMCNSCCDPCPDFNPSPAPCNFAMNAPFKIDLDACSWNILVNTSYLYWSAYEDGLTLYTTFESDTPIVDGDTTSIKYVYDQGEFDCNYSSGFKIGIGWQTGWDNWDLGATYLWFKNSSSNSFSLPNDLYVVPIEPPQNLPGTPKIAPTFELNPGRYDLAVKSSTKINSKWKIDLDSIEIDIGRAYYIGNCFILRPSWGLKNNYISQKITQDISFDSPTGTGGTTQGGTYSSSVTHTSTSWALGPRGAVECRWLLNPQVCGFSIIGKASMSLLYTSYTLKASENSLRLQGTSNVTSQYESIELETLHPCTHRPYADLGLGLNWGSYINCHSYYLDLFIGYDFLVLWGQNMFRVVEAIPTESQAPTNLNFDVLAEDLFLYGLTVSAALSF